MKRGCKNWRWEDLKKHNTLITKGRWEQIKTKLTWSGVPKDLVRRSHEQEREGRMIPTLPLLYDQTCCMHPPSVVCYAALAFSIGSDFGPKLMPKEKNQIAKRKICTVIQSLLSCLPNQYPDTTNEGNFDQGRICLLISNPTE